jgi:transcriptional regulator GlxA family with amidase domain
MKDQGVGVATRGTGRPAGASQQHFVFLLLDGFSLLSYATARETLRIANRAAGWQAFAWTIVSETGKPVASSDGDLTTPDHAMRVPANRFTLVICGGEDIAAASNDRILGWIRSQAAHGCHVAGLCTAAWTLAKAGLLTAGRATIHWENQDSFCETFPHITITGTPFVIDGRISTTAGGTSAIDLMLSFVAHYLDRRVALATSERMLYSAIHQLQEASRITPPDRLGVNNDKIQRAIGLMDQRLEEDISLAGLADELAISTRQLERLFRAHLMDSPKGYLNKMRLDRAQRLLAQTDMSVIKVASASGFQTASHFSRLFKRRFGHSPHEMRRGRIFEFDHHGD